jgi:hypothetical protein
MAGDVGFPALAESGSRGTLFWEYNDLINNPGGVVKT